VVKISGTVLGRAARPGGEITPHPEVIVAPGAELSYALTMNAPGTTAETADLLHEAAETHHIVYRIVDGDDPDWASWYADWLLNLSELPDLLGMKPVRSELVYALVRLDKEYTAAQPSERWENVYARELLAMFNGSATP
jgi:hypothetical protein